MTVSGRSQWPLTAEEPSVRLNPRESRARARVRLTPGAGDGCGPCAVATSPQRGGAFACGWLGRVEREPGRAPAARLTLSCFLVGRARGCVLTCPVWEYPAGRDSARSRSRHFSAAGVPAAGSRGAHRRPPCRPRTGAMFARLATASERLVQQRPAVPLTSPSLRWPVGWADCYNQARKARRERTKGVGWPGGGGSCSAPARWGLPSCGGCDAPATRSGW